LNQLAAADPAPEVRAQIAGLVGDGWLKTGRFDEAAEAYTNAKHQAPGDAGAHLRASIGEIRALLRAVRVDEAVAVAESLWSRAQEDFTAWEKRLVELNRQLQAGQPVQVPPQPPRPTVVAYRVARQFLDQGEPETAQDFASRAITLAPSGASRARQLLADLALRAGNADEARLRAREALLLGRFQAKTIPAWEILSRACQVLGVEPLDADLRAGLAAARPAVRARATHVLIHCFRRAANPVWKELASSWLAADGTRFPILATEIAKLRLAEARPLGTPDEILAAARAVLACRNLTPKEWFCASREVLRVTLLKGEELDPATLIQSAANQWGPRMAARAAHGFALSCMNARRHDLARPILEQLIQRIPRKSQAWNKAVWALARMEVVLENHANAARWWGLLADTPTVPTRFAVQARNYQLENLAASGDESAAQQLADAIRQRLANETDWRILLDAARQVAISRVPNKLLLADLAERAEANALKHLNTVDHPAAYRQSLRILIRRLYYDIQAYDRVVAIWKQHIEPKTDWMWTEAYILEEIQCVVARALCEVQSIDDSLDFLRRCEMDLARRDPQCGVQILATRLRIYVRLRSKTKLIELAQRMVKAYGSVEHTAEALYWLALLELARGNNRAAIETARRGVVALANGGNTIGHIDCSQRLTAIIERSQGMLANPSSKPGDHTEMRRLNWDLELLR
jgi:tetratricopeptide (TPR) repeat protein